ncbi:MAG: AbrB/MazE/SpoVT family DNA-binding domain-containing protein [Nanoarchaeota archaeon]|nr:AbrB/MazE/SpoVT family DNA-binding domain-containing protein [Nanoarchaeota archaeon]
MKRKLISQRNSLTLTLPKNWVKERNLNSKDEIDLVEEGDSIIINSGKKETKKEFTIDVSDYSEILIRNLLNQMYILSANKIIIRSNKQSKLVLCEKLSSLFLVGFEVIEKTKDKVILEALAIPSKDNLDQFILKIFNFLDSNFIFLRESFQKNDKHIYNEIKRDTKKISQYRNICKRILLDDPTNPIENKMLLEMINYLTEINHLLFHLVEEKIKVAQKLVEELEEIFNLIKKSYFKKDLDAIQHSQDKIERKLSEKNQTIYPILRNFYNLLISITPVALKTS